jgi:type I restriction enzyme S subunit
MTFPRYPKYKDSGVEWLGEVPAHWSIEPFKRQIERNDGGVWGDDPDGQGDTIVLRSTEQTVDGRWQLDDPAPRKLSETDINGSLLVESDLLMTKSSGSALHIGKTTLVTAEIAVLRCCYSNFMQRVRTR